MKHFRLFSTLVFFACLVKISLHAENQTDPDLLRLGNGIAAIAEGEIITVEALRRELEPIIPRLRVESKSAQEFSKRIDELSKEVLQNMIDRIIIVKAAEEKAYSFHHPTSTKSMKM